MDSLVSLANKNAMDDMSKMLTLSVLVPVLVPVSCNRWMLDVGCWLLVSPTSYTERLARQKRIVRVTNLNWKTRRQ